jgi:glutamine amidotransferase
MCRLLGIVAAEDIPVLECLTRAPRSLATLSHQHPDGWGLAVRGAASPSWSVHRSTTSAHACDEFRRLAGSLSASVVIAHVRQKTVGRTSLENTHPFVRGRWVFAHNGTLKDPQALAPHTSPERAAEVRGDTDTERLFAFLLTRLDEAGLTDGPASEQTDRVLGEATRKLREMPDFGAFNYVLSDGLTLYAHRFGRTLHLLRRGPGEVLVASEALTDEPWQVVDEGTLMRIDRADEPRVWVLAA